MQCLTWQRELRAARRESRAMPDPDAVLASLPLGAEDTSRVLAALLAKHNHRHAVKGKIVSDDTMSDRGNFLFNFFRRLRENTGFGRIDPRELGARHVSAMVKIWVAEGKTTNTIHVYLCYLRVFAEWIKKPGMVRTASTYVGKDSPHAHRSQIAMKDHSWEARGVEVAATIAKVAALDSWVGMQLELCWHFGMRTKEARFFRPNEAIRDREHARLSDARLFADATHFVRLRQGTKGGRVRDVPILTDAQRELICRIQRSVPKGGFVGVQHHSPEQSRNRFYWVLRRAGVTKRELGVFAHGLRHGYANDLYEAKSGRPSPVRGGGQKHDDDVEARQAVARALGHGRPGVTGYYIGAIQPTGRSEPKTESDAAHDHLSHTPKPV